MSNDIETVEILFDNGGGCTLQTATYAHMYDDIEQAAYDYMAIAEGNETTYWDGNESDARVTDRAHYQVFDHADILAIVAAGVHTSSWNNVRAFFSALGVTIED